MTNPESANKFSVYPIFRRSLLPTPCSAVPCSLFFYFYPDKKLLIFWLSKKINLFNKIQNFPHIK
ncbi:MAG: hypothetical protein F6K55_22365 [Moorea sp. SIO4A3]|nr:hypothetical protein [Moorena sp. SIO4A3]